MTKQELLGHAIDFLKGLAAACAVGIIVNGGQYIGAHIPDLLNFLGQVSVATTTIHLTKS